MQNSRFDELVETGMSAYHAAVEDELGENNAILMAVAAMLASSEEARRWKEPGPPLVPDTGPDELDDGPSSAFSEARTISLKARQPHQPTLPGV